MSENEIEAKSLRNGDTFKYANKTHVANKVTTSGGEVVVHISLDGSDGHRIFLKPEKKVVLVSRES